MSAFVEKLKKFWGKVTLVSNKIDEFGTAVYRFCFKIRKIVLAAPVVYYAVKFAMDNAERLPETVGLNMQSNGQFAVLVTRNYAVYGPLGVTLFCLLLMFFSRKTIFPWVISIFTLVLPWLIYLTNIYSFG